MTAENLTEVFVDSTKNTNPVIDINIALLNEWKQSSDKKSFMQIILLNEGLLRRVILITLGSIARNDPSIIDDVMQETVIRLLSCLKKFRYESGLPAFLASVARRAALDEIRKNARHNARTKKAFAFSSPDVFVEDDLAKQNEKQAAAEAVLKKLDALPEPEKSLLYLHEAEGISIEVLSRTFKIPQGTIKSKLSRARNKIHDEMFVEWGNYE